MRRPAHAQVDLAQVDPLRSDEEIDAERADHALVGQHPPDPERSRFDVRSISRPGRIPAPEVHLLVRPAQHLIVGAQQLDFTH